MEQARRILEAWSFGEQLGEFTGHLARLARRRRSWGLLHHGFEHRDTIGDHELSGALGVDLLRMHALSLKIHGATVIGRESISQILVHDNGENYAVDLATPDGVSNEKAKAAARRLEAAVNREMVAPLKIGTVAASLLGLMESESAQESVSARFVKVVDRLDAVLYRELVLPPEEFEEGHFIKHVIGPGEKLAELDQELGAMVLQLLNDVKVAAKARHLQGQYYYPVRKGKLEPSDKLIHLLKLFQNLKRTKREGWIAYDVSPENCDSFAQHSAMTSQLVLALTYYLEESGIQLDIERCLRLSIWQDTYRLGGGDMSFLWAPAGERAYLRDDLKEIWAAKVGSFAALFPVPEAGVDYQKLMEEMIHESSPEALVVRFCSFLSDFHFGLNHVPYRNRNNALAMLETAWRSRCAEVAQTRQDLAAVLTKVAQGYSSELIHNMEKQGNASVAWLHGKLTPSR